MKLYTYFRSSAAYRVRIALNLKGLSYDAIPVHLTRTGGEHRQEGYTAINPAALVPALVDETRVLTQSMAIIEYLDETHPEPALLPGSALDRARIRAIAQAIACDIHPINNLRVLQYLGRELGASEEQKNAWYRHWVELGLQAVEAMLADDARTGAFCHGDTPTLADCCLVPQVFNARRFNCRMEAFPTINRIVDRCEAMEPFRLAAPSNQADAE
ncbi:maleylacetoacetate isomerase [Azoarcus communis]|uniref:Maleylacetoacetate isomerase n=1 Tax=Parazoarcus communis SWub3 = DSM 12120 TaxID=1121029 RepID=A0A323UUW5_9RHOO|nr:maleylacetoacetate isomerase [Parazoarcus communis]NMG47089.1 maleylacetoacetate isomerase [Parazoarcus communis]NMG70210.1 maleylacetoacetate isomerase [Parazoarcus communis SWub3 = DSM 12120]PZA15991.1 maleylacetoacetate isomerase [Azoarcus communis] [Parazoarcus communis SWub3 = DSM 12120]